MEKIPISGQTVMEIDILKEPRFAVLMQPRVNIRYRVRTVEYFKFPNLEGAMVWEKGAIRKQENNFF